MLNFGYCTFVLFTVKLYFHCTLGLHSIQSNCLDSKVLVSRIFDNFSLRKNNFITTLLFVWLGALVKITTIFLAYCSPFTISVTIRGIHIFILLCLPFSLPKMIVPSQTLVSPHTNLTWILWLKFSGTFLKNFRYNFFSYMNSCHQNLRKKNWKPFLNFCCQIF